MNGQGSKTRVVIGMDPHKRSVTIEVMTADESVVGGGRFSTTAAGYRSMLEDVGAWSNRVWAIEGCNGIGRQDAEVCTYIAGVGDLLYVPPGMLCNVMSEPSMSFDIDMHDWRARRAGWPLAGTACRPPTSGTTRSSRSASSAGCLQCAPVRAESYCSCIS